MTKTSESFPSGISSPDSNLASVLREAIVTKWVRSSLFLLTLFFMMGNGIQEAYGDSDSLSNTRSTLEKWVQTRQLISTTKSDWESDKELLNQTIQLFERELESVQEQMSALSTNSAQADKERLEAEALLARSNESLESATRFAVEFQNRLDGLIPRLPTPLQEILKPHLNKLPEDAANTQMRITDRMQVLVTVLNEVDKFNNAITIFSGEKRKNEKGEEVSVETVYVGLGSAYFVNDSGDFAGMGSLGAGGWEWTNRSELASSVREVIRIYRNERTARFVSLPVVIR